MYRLSINITLVAVGIVTLIFCCVLRWMPRSAQSLRPWKTNGGELWLLHACPQTINARTITINTGSGARVIQCCMHSYWIVCNAIFCKYTQWAVLLRIMLLSFWFSSDELDRSCPKKISPVCPMYMSEISCCSVLNLFLITVKDEIFVGHLIS